MTHVAVARREKPGIFERLEARGIGAAQYGQIKRILIFDLPQSTLFFQKQFGPHTPSQVLQKVDRWRRFLRGDFLLSGDLKQDLVKAIDGAEIFAWNALIEACFPGIGAWTLSRKPVPTSIDDGRPRYIQPDTRITAVHEASGETRTAMIPGDKPLGPEWCASWNAAFETLGLLELAQQQFTESRLVAANGPWPIFTQFAIPRLYEFLLPYYPAKAHITTKERVLTRKAYYPQDLLEDMLDILRMEQPHFFNQTKPRHLKAVIQRYRESKSTETHKTDRFRQTSTSF